MSLIPVATDKNVEINSFENVIALRFQPLVDLSSGLTIAHEVLVEVNNISPGDFFSFLPPEYSLALFFWQAKEILRSPYLGQFWLNLPVAVYLNPQAVNRLCNFNHQGQLTLEIQDPQNLLNLNTLEKRTFQSAIQLLKNAGWKVWLDDLTFDTEDALSLLCLPVDGVKIDRREIHFEKRLTQLITMVKGDFSSPVLVEGIETECDRKTVLASGAEYGQGFLWPELRIPAQIPSEVSLQAEDWRNDTLLDNNHKIKVAISCPNTYLKEGIIHLINAVCYGRLKSKIWPSVDIITNEKHADIIFRYCLPGESPFDCRLLLNDSRYRARVLRTRYVILNDAMPKTLVINCPGITATFSSFHRPEYILKTLKDRLTFNGSRMEYTSKFKQCCQACHKHALTALESEIVLDLGKGASLASVAQRLGCTSKRISYYKRSVMKKMCLTNNLEFYTYALMLCRKEASVLRKDSYEG